MRTMNRLPRTLGHPRPGRPARPLRRRPVRHLLDRGQHDPPVPDRRPVPGDGRRSTGRTTHGAPLGPRVAPVGRRAGPAAGPAGGRRHAGRRRSPGRAVSRLRPGPASPWCPDPGRLPDPPRRPTRDESGPAPHRLQRPAPRGPGRGVSTYIRELLAALDEEIDADLVAAVRPGGRAELPAGRRRRWWRASRAGWPGP